MTSRRQFLATVLKLVATAPLINWSCTDTSQKTAQPTIDEKKYIDVGKAAARQLLQAGYTNILVTDYGHEDAIPRLMAVGALQAVQEHSPDSNFFGLEAEETILKAFQNQASYEIPQGAPVGLKNYIHSNALLAQQMSAPKTTAIAMDEGVIQEQEDYKAIEAKMNGLDPKTERYKGLSAERDKRKIARQQGACDRWPQNIATHKGNAKAGVILAGLGHFIERSDIRVPCDVSKEFQQQGIPLGKILAQSPLDYIPQNLVLQQPIEKTKQKGIIPIFIGNPKTESRFLAQKEAIFGSRKAGDALKFSYPSLEKHLEQYPENKEKFSNLLKMFQKYDFPMGGASLAVDEAQLKRIEGEFSKILDENPELWERGYVMTAYLGLRKAQELVLERGKEPTK